MNPIEKVFSVLKSQLKRWQILTGTDEDIAIINDLLLKIVTPELMATLFHGSDYADIEAQEKIHEDPNQAQDTTHSSLMEE
ncbi:hypothetical protein PGTUg99_036562 [Puccinia graminis f. sp. tritici]|uniref:Uncharacterized protein n=1 Tax=Puccinia graminis f. sp. tritici TaxID=56615 RepID=A0A5B0SGH3_PUCGR|nr:hypothetical protein PGTUg99_016096 [Puccinia graminis f. sp. tritici]KAA1136635.1 hypothetical protein PGTUg99_036562 [Puccinia graminis f. sp. tritici]